MKALVVDAAARRMVVSAKNGDATVSLSVDAGTGQSRRLLPAIDFVLKETEIEPCDLDYTALTSGPGAFTGLRLAFSALKALELSFGVPTYGVRTLDAYAEPFLRCSAPVVSVIDAKKDQFFVSLYDGEALLVDGEDTDALSILRELTERALDSETVFVVGPAARPFSEKLRELGPSFRLVTCDGSPDVARSLFNLAEKAMERGDSPLAEYDGPFYARKSEAEIKLEKAVP